MDEERERIKNFEDSNKFLLGKIKRRYSLPLTPNTQQTNTLIKKSTRFFFL